MKGRASAGRPQTRKRKTPAKMQPSNTAPVRAKNLRKRLTNGSQIIFTNWNASRYVTVKREGSNSAVLP